MDKLTVQRKCLCCGETNIVDYDEDECPSCHGSYSSFIQVATQDSAVSSKHDAHYRAIESTGIEPITLMEQILCTAIPAELHDQVKRNFNAAMSAKYLLRMGHKDAANKELDKAINYAHRSRHGKWIS
jgi:hypothetical protein